MAKRRRYNDNLTGGSCDVNPQFLSASATQDAIDTNVSFQYSLPKSISAPTGKATVVEVLKVFCLMTNPQDIASVIEVQQYCFAHFSTANHGAVEAGLQAADVFTSFYRFQQGAWTAAGSYGFAEPSMVICHDLTDGAGHGVLVATDNFYVQIGSAGTGVLNAVYFKILYRYKIISLIEYIGIVQSQQAVAGV